MNRLERTRLIKHVAERLSEEEWGIIFMILHQFSLSNGDPSQWNYDPLGYVIAMIGDADNDTLKELGDYYAIGSWQEHSFPFYQSESPDFWEDGCYRMFISHRSKHKEAVKTLQAALSCCGISAFVAHVDIRPSKAWLEQIELALKTCDGLLAYLTPDFDESEWTDQEIGFALARGIRIIPLDCGKLPYGFIGKYQALKIGSLKDIQIAVKVMKAVMTDSRPGPAFSDLLIRKLETSSHFSTSTMVMTALEALSSLGKQDLERIDKAYESNAQFSGVKGMRSRLKRLHSKCEEKVSA